MCWWDGKIKKPRRRPFPVCSSQANGFYCALDFKAFHNTLCGYSFESQSEPLDDSMNSVTIHWKSC